MGIVINQSVKNLIFTYIGFAIGAMNTMFLYPYIMDDQYYGLVAVLLSTAMIFYPLLSLSMGNSIIRFYPHYQSKSEKNKFISFTFIFPLLAILPFFILFSIFGEQINNLLSNKSELVKDYTVYILIYAVFIGYFEVFYSFAKVQFKSVFGNVLKEISIRVFVTFLIALLYFNVISDDGFIFWLAIGYGVRTLVMAIYSISISDFKFSFQSFSKYKKVISFSIFVIVASSVSQTVIEIDKFMISQYIDLSNVAYYAVGGFIGIVVSVPGRAMQQILAPFVSKALSDGNFAEVNLLYKKSSINLLVVSGLIFVLIAVNVKFLYMLLPVEFKGGEYVAIIIAFGKLFDMVTGINGTIITNSKYYRFDLLFSLILLVLTIGLNMIFIPVLGMLGASIATGLSIVFYNLMKLIFVKLKFGHYPFTLNSLLVFMLILLLTVTFYILPLLVNPILSIFLYSSIIGILYLMSIIYIKPSDEINTILVKYLPFLK